jgi:hypothetical protein
VIRGRDDSGPETDRCRRRDWWSVTLEAPDPHALVVFWSALVGRPTWNESADGGSLDLREGVGSPAVQRAEHHQPPVFRYT